MRFWWILLILSWCNAQFSPQDSIKIRVRFDLDAKAMYVKQEIKLANQTAYRHTYLHAWANAYKDRHTELSKTKLAARNDRLYFAGFRQRGWIDSLVFFEPGGKRLPYYVVDNEFVRIEFPDNLNKKFTAEYKVILPDEFITGYGLNPNGNLILKYFFLQPATIQNGEFYLEHFRDFENLSSNPTYYELRFDPIPFYQLHSNIEPVSENFYKGSNRDFVIIYLRKNDSKEYSSFRDGRVVFTYRFPEEEFPLIDSLISKQLDFLENRLVEMPDRIMISNRVRRNEKFQGVDDIEVPVLGKFKLFTDEERLALILFQQIADRFIDRVLFTHPNPDHWIENGLKTYLLMEYIEAEFPDLKLAGHLPDDIKIWNFYPLKIFDAADLKMIDRFKLAYQFMVSENLDQPVNTHFDELSNLNQQVVSGFKTALSFYYMKDYLGENEFDALIRAFVIENQSKLIVADDFKNFITSNAGKDLSWFYDDYINDRNKINYSLIRQKPKGDSVEITVRNKTAFSGPFKIAAIRNDSVVSEQWYTNPSRKFRVQFPAGDYNKLIVNPDYYLPEFNERDNYLKTKGLFPHRKRLSVKFLSDIENPEYNQIFFMPELKWNNYDKILLGMKLTNRTLIPGNLVWSLTPMYSTGESTLAGKGSIRYKFLPTSGWFREITVGTGMAYQHYAKDLAYTKWGTYVQFNFNKKARDLISRSVGMSYDQINRDLASDATLSQIELADYNFFNVIYRYWNPQKIHEKQALVNLQVSNKFKKLFGEFYWRWQFSKKKRLGVRVFGGIFLDYKLNNTDMFDYGLDRISDYTFSYPLLGRSETTGLWSQQFVLAEGGFKSNFFARANEYMFTTNLEYPLWRFIDIYADGGMFKNRGESLNFVYDSGFRVRVIPDFLELYFPVQSSLGFEPAEGDYLKRIRFMFTFDLGKIVSYWSRGKY